MNNEQYTKDLSLLRPFDLEAAKNGAEICWSHLPDRVKFVGVTSNGLVVYESESCLARGTGSQFRMKPLTWVEGKPVYKGDVLYSKICPEYMYITKSVEGDLLYTEDNVTASFCECIEQLTWNKPKQKVKRKVWINVYPDTRNWPGCAYWSKESADNSACNDRIACVETEIEYEVYPDYNRYS